MEEIKDIEITNAEQIISLQNQIYILNDFVLREQARLNEYLNLLAKHGLFSMEDVQDISAKVEDKIQQIQKEQKEQQAEA